MAKKPAPKKKAPVKQSKPAPKKAVKPAAKKVVKFKAGSELAELVNKKGKK